MTRYKTAADQCDVRNRAGLEEYRTKRERWLDWYEFRPSEPNSIQAQLFSMIFLDLGYRIVANLRKREKASEYAAASGLLVRLLDQGYVANQILAIRKLMDGRKDVISVRRLLDDVSASRSLITREIYVCYDGLPYEHDSWRNSAQSQEERIFGIEAPGLHEYLASKYRHERFDRLAGVAPDGRTRDDVVRPGVFANLVKWLEDSPATKLITLSHKFFAHAADNMSRDSLVYSGIQLTDVAETQRAIIRVERAITDHLLYLATARDVVPFPPLGLVQGLDKLFAPVDAITTMHSEWDALADQRNKWAEGLDEDLYQ